jgi:D-proline reductase (dithiol) PrdB
MARLSDLKLKYRLLMEAYPYRRLEWRPGSVLRKSLSEARIAVVTTAAFFRPDHAPFDPSIRGGDCSFREIPADTPLCILRIAHKSDAFDHSGIETDKNLALPLDRLRELREAGLIGELAPLHYSFMGSISAPGRLIKLSIPEVARKLGEQKADVVLLTPV